MLYYPFANLDEPKFWLLGYSLLSIITYDKEDPITFWDLFYWCTKYDGPRDWLGEMEMNRSKKWINYEEEFDETPLPKYVNDTLESRLYIKQRHEF